MIITFFSNYFNHHQKALCDGFFNIEGVEFYFVETEPMEEFRANMGWGVESLPPYVIQAHLSEQNNQAAMELSRVSDAVIIGSAPDEYVSSRIKDNKLTFRYTERPMKEGWIKMFIPRLGKKFYKLHYQNRNRKCLYVLGASAYAAYDYSLLRSYPGRVLKFGYFPVREQLSLEDVMKSKDLPIFEDERSEKSINILWTGRFLKLKRADLLIKALGIVNKRLKDEQKNISISLDFIGNGEEEENCKRLVEANGLANIVKFHDFVKPDEVRCLMEKADIYVMTSNFLEGWGSVIYESLAAGCGVIASHACGCTPWLVIPEKTGLIFKSGSKISLADKLYRFITDDELRKTCQTGAYIQMSDLWNPDVAAQRIVELTKAIGENPDDSSISDMFTEGPLSKARILKNNWFKE